MPHHPGDQTYPHLRLVHEDVSHERRRRPAPPSPPPPRGGRTAFAAQFTQRLSEIESETLQKPAPVPGIKPHLVFRLPVTAAGPIDTLIERFTETGLTIVSIESDKAVVAFRDDADLNEFRRAVGLYQRGPRSGAKSTKWDVLEYIDAGDMRSWDKSDRIGSRLRDEIGADAHGIEKDRRYIVEVELWHPGTDAGARRLLTEVEQLIAAASSVTEKIHDTFVGDSLCMAKATVTGLTLLKLLELTSIAEIELPPTPVFDSIKASKVTRRDFPAPPPPADDGPRLCILDSGITSNHPLLGPLRWA